MIYNINTAFNEWYNELEGFHLRSERITEIATPQQLAQWLTAAFQAGAKSIAQDTLDTLGDYATAMSGVEHIKYTPTQAFDSAHANLHTYYTQIFKEL